jgi:hypothetical protein
VNGIQQRYDDRERAREAGLETAAWLVAGERDYRGLYQGPRPAYLDRFNELTGR